MDEKVLQIIKHLTKSSKQQLTLYRDVHIISSFLNKRPLNNVGLIPSNGYYGHEFWIKKYSKCKHPICALIEHGLYLGRNTQKVGDEIEYELNSILTYGDYREEILLNSFPNFQIEKIGPRIAYAETDINYLKELNTGYEKVLTVFPAHSLSSIRCKYDVDYLLGEAKKVQEERDIPTIRICLPYPDIINGNAKEFENRGCEIVTGGANAIDFLPRLRAIIETSTLTLSNSLGTNLGYCLYLGKQQILIPQNIEYTGNKEAIEQEAKGKSENQKSVYEEEQEYFLKLFNKDIFSITNEQKKVANYFWGYEFVKTPEEMNNLIDELFIRYKKL